MPASALAAVFGVAGVPAAPGAGGDAAADGNAARLAWLCAGCHRAGDRKAGSEAARAVLPQERRVRLAGGGGLDYARLVVAPGIELDYGAVEGYSAEAARRMPKSAFSANSQAKACVRYVLAALHGGEPSRARFFNTCWSFPAPGDAVSVGASYEARGDAIASVDTFISSVSEDPQTRAATAQEAKDWYAAFTADLFG